MSFGSPFTAWSTAELPIDSTIVAPYWADIDLSDGDGLVNYTVLLQSNGSSYIDMVDRFFKEKGIGRTPTMILVAQWLNVCPYPASASCSASVCTTALLLLEVIINYIILGKLLSSSDSY